MTEGYARRVKRIGYRISIPYPFYPDLKTLGHWRHIVSIVDERVTSPKLPIETITMDLVSMYDGNV